LQNSRNKTCGHCETTLIRPCSGRADSNSEKGKRRIDAYICYSTAIAQGGKENDDAIVSKEKSESYRDQGS